MTDPRRIHLDQVDLQGPMWTLRRRKQVARRILLLSDSLAIFSGLIWLRFDAERATMVASCLLFYGVALLSLVLAGGYRTPLRVRRGHGVTVALSYLLSLVLSWLLLRFAHLKLSLWLFETPNSIQLFFSGLVVALYLNFSRRLLDRWIFRPARRAKIVYLGLRHQEVEGELSARGAPAPLLPVSAEGDDVAMAEALRLACAQPIQALVVDVPLSRLGPACLAVLLHVRFSNQPVISLLQLYEEFFECTPLSLDLSWVLGSDKLRPGSDPIQESVKRCFDVACALSMGLFALPICVVMALLIRLDSKGPALYKQVRTGQFNRPFTILKLRTMRADAEVSGAVWAQTNDPRVTRLGSWLRRTRIDELPQLYNVLVGEMSMVGPRPERPEFNEGLSVQLPYYDLRHTAKPGITGWAQVNYPYGASVEDAARKLEYDAYYIRHASIFVDLVCLVRTVGVVLGRKGR